METKRNRKFNFMSILVVAALVGCGGAGDTASADHDDDTTKSNNQSSNNTTTNNSPSNNTPSNNANNDPVFIGDVGFVQPAEATVYTNGELTLEAMSQGDATDVELMLNDAEVLTTFDASMQHTWDTNGIAEGTHTLKLRYALASDLRWSNDLRTVVVDRTAPVITEKLPAPGSSDNASDAILRVRFDEPMDPESFNPSTVRVAFSGEQTTDYTVELSEDGLAAEIDFDRSTIATPYNATITLDGTSDLAGNAVSYSWNFSVPAWLKESIPRRLRDLHITESPSGQYLIGLAHGSPDHLVVMKKGATGWTEVLSEPMDQIYDMAVERQRGTFYIAMVRRAPVLNTVKKTAHLYAFKTFDDTLTTVGQILLGEDSNNGAVAIDMRTIGNVTSAAIAAVSDEELYLYRFEDEDFGFQTPQFLPGGINAYTRDESLSVFVQEDGDLEVLFAHCTKDSIPCLTTRVERLMNIGGQWTLDAGHLETLFTDPASQTCDEFVNFEVDYLGETPFLMFAQEAPCGSLTSMIYLRKGTNAGWSGAGVSDMIADMPAPSGERFSGHIAAGPNGEIYALVASPQVLMVARHDQDEVTWMPRVAESLSTSPNDPAQMIVDPRLFVDENGPIVLFGKGDDTYIYRPN